MNIYDFTDYRQFLKAYYEESKAASRSFSYGMFARKAGLKSKGIVHRVVSGKRSLTKGMLFKIAQAMQLDDKAFAYFQHLVAYSQSKDAKEKAFFFHKLMEANPTNRAKRLHEDTHEFFTQWYYSTLRELLPLIRFKDDYAHLGKLLDPPISPKRTREAVALLLRLGLIERSKTGFRQSDRAVTSGSGVPGGRAQGLPTAGIWPWPPAPSIPWRGRSGLPARRFPCPSRASTSSNGKSRPAASASPGSRTNWKSPTGFTMSISKSSRPRRNASRERLHEDPCAGQVGVLGHARDRGGRMLAGRKPGLDRNPEPPG